MELFELSVLYPRWIFVFLGWIIFAILRLWSIKNVIDELTTPLKRKTAWGEHKRKHFEDYIIAIIFGLILATVMNVIVAAYDAVKETEYNHLLTKTYVDLGISFIIGVFSLKILKKLKGKGDQIDNFNL